MTVLRIPGYACIVLCLAASISAQTINWQSSGGNTTTTDKVGIGSNTAPSSMLELNAPAVVQTIRYTDPNYGSLYFYENTTFVGFLQMVGSTYAPYPTARNALMLGNLTAGPEIFYTNSAERMRIDASGNIGIGTSAPAAKLQVEDLTNNAEILVSAGDNPGVPNSPSLSLMRKDGYDVQLATYGLKLDAADGNKFKLLYGGAGGFTATPLVVDTSGNVGIGTSAPPHRLTVSGGFIAIDNGSQLIGGGVGNTFYYRLIGNDSANRIILGDTSSSVATEIRFHTNGSLTPAMLVNTAGNVGIGVTAPGQKLSVAGTIESTSGGIKFPDGTVQTSASTSSNSALTATNPAGDATMAAVASTGVAYVRLASGEATPLKDWRVGLLDNSGLFKIRDNVAAVDRMTINGSSIHFNGNVDGTTIQATYQDVAEWVPAAEAIVVGSVVVIDTNARNTVTASKHAYDTSVAGVVSPNPGLLLGVAGESKAKIATTGRVRVRVDAGKSPIHTGDLLVTSDRPGMAMKSEPVDVAGLKMHRPGTLIGKALEPLESGEGEILVLLSLQ
jgi:hypothetical protein